MGLVVRAVDSCPKKRGFQLKKKSEELRSPLPSHQQMTVQKGDAAVTSSGCQGFRVSVTRVGRALGMQRLVLSGDAAGSVVPFRAFKS